MSTAFDLGTNRTGIKTSPIEAPRTIEGAEQGSSPPGDEQMLSSVRASFAREADPIGSVPPPASLKGAVKAVAQALKGEKANVFIDKLGERLAFERAGVRLYDLAVTKAQAYPGWEGGPTAADLLEIQRDELLHFGLLQRCLETLGADPTAMTPSADLAANLSKGVPAVLADPRTDLRQCVEGLLVAELTDNASWELLIGLARELEQEEMAVQFERALANEQRHLSRVKSWLRDGVMEAASRVSGREDQSAARH